MIGPKNINYKLLRYQKHTLQILRDNHTSNAYR